ncbi:hypothetical protein C5167_023343 [Papaver somniferum]|uniref:CCT domain-containing protein n=1 Tax=Papaver somniferum TaxID=3469 RepID=A0A4Y7JLF2_PAPSO|nr:zinc finger protein CONSTANS-LIKE 16-like [Papaver somniferum]RZC61587.1 hypothetical protein C5167_023343 [Papaver somniferum]
MWSNSENKVKMRTRSSSSTSSSPRSVLSKKSKKKSVTNEPQQSSKSKPLAKKARKHKLLSDLRRQLSKNDTRDDQKMSHDDDDDDDDDDQLLINLFPLHPKRSLIKESDKNNHRMKDLQHEEDHNNTVVTYNFFDTTTDCGAASLTGLLWDSIEGVDKQCSTEQQEESLSPQSLTYSFQGEASDGLYGNSLLLRTALRQKEREIDSSTTEEKWVFYSEVVEKKEEEDMSTCTLDSGNHYYNTSTQISPRLSLKLDYEVIMNAWSDRGSLYIGGDCSSSQIVPDILDDPLTPDSTNNVTYGDAAGCMLWKVPEHHLRHDGAQSIREDHSKMMEEREARVLRYKEKRQNRLFSKRIRYEVRKLNAEKRPRMKGRFVRRS